MRLNPFIQLGFFSSLLLLVVAAGIQLGLYDDVWKQVTWFSLRTLLFIIIGLSGAYFIFHIFIKVLLPDLTNMAFNTEILTKFELKFVIFYFSVILLQFAALVSVLCVMETPKIAEIAEHYYKSISNVDKGPLDYPWLVATNCRHFITCHLQIVAHASSSLKLMRFAFIGFAVFDLCALLVPLVYAFIYVFRHPFSDKPKIFEQTA